MVPLLLLCLLSITGLQAANKEEEEEIGEREMHRALDPSCATEEMALELLTYRPAPAA